MHKIGQMMRTSKHPALRKQKERLLQEKQQVRRKGLRGSFSFDPGKTKLRIPRCTHDRGFRNQVRGSIGDTNNGGDMHPSQCWDWEISNGDTTLQVDIVGDGIGARREKGGREKRREQNIADICCPNLSLHLLQHSHKSIIPP
jgi:hypothetical protein